MKYDYQNVSRCREIAEWPHDICQCVLAEDHDEDFHEAWTIESNSRKILWKRSIPCGEKLLFASCQKVKGHEGSHKWEKANKNGILWSDVLITVFDDSGPRMKAIIVRER